MAAVNIIIPTFKRAGNVKGFNYFKSSKLCVSESQSAEYARHYGKRRLLVMPDEFEGNIARKRNWILRNVKRPLLMVDDDVEHIAT